jgi:hypothetical protein
MFTGVFVSLHFVRFHFFAEFVSLMFRLNEEIVSPKNFKMKLLLMGYPNTVKPNKAILKNPVYQRMALNRRKYRNEVL